MHSLSCPSPEVLRRFLLGQVSQEELTQVEGHLEECPHCLQALPTVEVRDALVEAVRCQAQAPRACLDERIALAIRRLEDAPQLAAEGRTVAETPSPSVEASAAEGTGGRRGEEELAELAALLDPPQGEGELGRLGVYRVLGLLGRGGMGVVFRAEDTRLGRLVALKVLRPYLADSPRARQRFLREARAAAAVEHEHVVHINEVGEDHGIPFVAMPLLRGESLEARARREGRLPTAEVLRIGREVAEGLAAAHARGLVHRDIKPANVWLEGESGRVKILDFGLARAAAEDAQITGSGCVVGTPAFMAPEQARGAAPDGRADLFSLGGVLYRMSTGRLPFVGATAIEVLHSLATEEPAPVVTVNPDVPPPLAALIHRLLCKDPAGRPGSAREVAEALTAIGRGAAVPASASTLPLPYPYPARESGKGARAGLRRLPRKLMLLVLPAAGLAALAFWLGPALLRPGSNRGEPAVERDRPSSPPAFPLTLAGVGNEVRRLTFSPDSRLLIAAGNADVKVWDLATGKEPFTLEQSKGNYFGLAVRADGRQVACGGYYLAKVWDLRTGRLLRNQGMPGEVDCVAYGPDGRLLLSACNLWNVPSPTTARGSVIAWDAETGRARDYYARGTEEGYGWAAFSPDGGQVAAVDFRLDPNTQTAPSGHVWVWQAGSGKLLHKFRCPRAGYLFSFSPDSRLLAGPTGEGTIRLWDVKKGQELSPLRLSGEKLGGVAFAPDSRRLVSVGETDAVRIWNLDTGRSDRTFRAGRPCRWVAWSPDGRFVAAAADPQLTVWDLTQGPEDRPSGQGEP